jgi:hypothetical protein
MVSTARTRPPGPPWWALLPPAQAEVSCGEQTHRLRWAEGRLTAADHPDAEGELVLAALGGDRCECVDLVGWWGTRRDDLEVLAVGPRSAADELTVTPENMAEPGLGQGGWVAYAPLTGRTFPMHAVAPWAQRLPGGMAVYGAFLRAWGPPPAVMRRRAAMRATAAMKRQLSAGRSPYAAATSSVRISRVSSVRTSGMSSMTGRGSPVRASRIASVLRSRPGRQHIHDELERASARRRELFSLLALGPEFQLRLSATVAAAWADGGGRAGERDAARPALVAALAGRLAPAAQAWLGVDPDRVDVSLHEDDGWGRMALSGTGRDRRLSAALPAGWLASVWAAGLAVTAGHLVVAVMAADWPDATVLAVPEPGADPVILKVRAEGGGWTASQKGAVPPGHRSEGACD